MRVLRLVLSAPMMSFGGTTLCVDRPSDLLPHRSMLTGLLANALGWDVVDDRPRLQRLQARLRFAACHTRAVNLQETDLHTAATSSTDKLWSTRGTPIGRAGASKSHYGGPVMQRKDYLVGARVAVGLTLTDPAEADDAAVTLEALARALQQPARTLYIGRKCCLPDRPLFDGLIEAPDPLAAIAGLVTAPDGAAACWDPGYGPQDTGRAVQRADLRDWQVHLPRGRSTMHEGWLPCAGPPAAPALAAVPDTPAPEVRSAGTGALHLCRLVFNVPQLANWAVAEGVDHTDTGYLLHLATRVALGAAGPQPFRIRTRGPELTLTGYCRDDGETLGRIAGNGPLARVLEQIETVPVPVLPAGLTARFDLEAIPTTRVRGRERDAHRPDAPGDRAASYRDWLARRLGPAVQLEEVALTAFDLRRTTRRDAAGNFRARTLPWARFAGTLRIADPDAMTDLLTRGIGRHAAFGAGALLLSPA